MLISLWSLKGGVGCSVTAALLALHAARHDDGVTLVDLGGDQALVLGCPVPEDPGVTDLLTRSDRPDGLAPVGSPVAPGLTLVPCGTSAWPDALEAGVVDRFVGALTDLPGTVLVDAGLVLGRSSRAAVARGLAAQATRSILVTRACYLALSRLAATPVLPSGVIVLREPGRSLGVTDVEAAARAPVVAELEVDPAVARSVDAGLLLARPPRGLDRALRAVA